MRVYLYPILYRIPGISSVKTTLSRLLVRFRVAPTKEEAHSHNCTDRVLLSFDDDCEIDSLEKILEILADSNTKAAFFLIGTWVEKHPEVVVKLREQGHWVGNHSYSHKNFLRLDDDGVKTEILGGVSSTLLRPPFGLYNDRVRKVARNLGYKISYWTVDSDDWRGLTAKQIINRVCSEIHPGACVLLHLNSKHTVEALPGLIKEIRRRGYELCSEGTEIKLS